METILLDRYLRRHRKEKKTYKSYQSSMSGFYKYLLEEKKFRFDSDEELILSLTVKDVEDYFYYIDDKDYKKSTINHKIVVVKDFFSYLVDGHIITFNLADTLKIYNEEKVKEDTEEKYIPTKNEILRLINATYEQDYDGRNQDYNNARDRFYMALLTTTGLRADYETLGITMDEIEEVDGGYMINIPKERVKNKINKRVPVPQSIIKYFEEYKLQRMIFNEKFNSNLLFLSRTGQKLDCDNMNKRIKKMCERANISENITNHCFRHFLTQHLESNNVGENLILKILGWKDGGGKGRMSYTGKANDRKYDNEKLKACDVFR